MVLDDIIDNKVGLGRYQYLIFFCLSLSDLNDGTQLILSSFLTPIIQQQWALTQDQASNLASIFYLGGFLGCIISGKLSDQYGRKPIIIIGSIMQIMVCAFFFFIDTYMSMLFTRALYGLAFGFTISITTSVFAQITPSVYRGKGILFLNFCVSLGKLYGLFLAYIFLDSFTSGNWRAMMILSCLPNIIVFVYSITKLQQTPRFLIATQQFQKAYKVINIMIKENHPIQQQHRKLFITQQEKSSLVQYYKKAFQNKPRAEFKSLFNQYYLRTTICFCVAWFSINFMYFGQLVALPFIFGKTSKSFTSYTFTVLGQIPSFFLSVMLVDRPNFGRKNSLKYFFCLSGFLHILFAINPLTLFSSLSRFFMKMCFQMLYPCTTQSYGTLNRTLGFGFNSAIGRLGSTIMPFIILPLVEVNVVLIPIVFAFVAFTGAIASHILPRQPMDRALDNQTQSNLSDNQQDQLDKHQILLKQ